MGISIEVREAPTIDLDPKVPPLDPSVANQRATMAHYGLGEESPGIDQILSDMSNGVEDQLRRRVATSKDLKIFNEKQAILREKAQDGSLTPDEAIGLTSSTRPTNPDTVLENSFANRLVNDVASKNSHLEEAIQGNPDTTYDLLDQATWMQARQNIARTLIEDLQAKKKASGWGTYLSDIAEQAIPLKTWINTQGAVQAAGDTGLMGQSIEEQYQYLYSLPPDEFQRQAKQAIDNIAQSNLFDAQHFAEGLLGYSKTSKALDSVFSIMDITGVGGTVAGLGKVAAKGLAIGAVRNTAKIVTRSGAEKIVEKAPSPAILKDARIIEGSSKYIGDVLSSLPTSAGIKVYHGSRHEFEAFDRSKMGTGEGAQAYGHGLYFSDKKGVAESYSKAGLHPPKLDRYDPERTANWIADNNIDTEKFKESIEYNLQGYKDALAELEPDEDVLRSEYQSFIAQGEDEIATIDEANELLKNGYQPKTTPKGNLYEALIKVQPDELIDWDKPIEEQSYLVQKVFKDFGIEPASKGKPADWLSEATGIKEFRESGSSAYEALEKRALDQGFSKHEFVDTLHKSGIKGIKFLDGGSRDFGEGTFNYVVFSDQDVTILRRNDEVFKNRYDVDISPNVENFNFTSANDNVAKALRDTLEATAEVKVAPETIAAASGDLDKAATVHAFKMMKDKIRPQDPFHRATDLLNSVPSFINPFGISPLASASERTLRIMRSLQASRDLLMGGITDVGRLNRTTDAAILRAVEMTKRNLENQFTEHNNTILDVNVLSNDKNLGNIWTVEAKLGNPDGTYFKTPSEGFEFAEHGLKLQTDQYEVKQQGNGFYISMIKDVDETQNAVRDVLFEEGNNNTPKSWVSSLPFIGYFRTPEDTLDTLSRQNRGAAVHGQEQLQRIAGQVANEITKIGKKDHKKLKRILEENRNERIVNPDNPEDVKIGKFFETIDEFEDAWQRHNGTLPSEKVTTAYFKYIQLNDWDYVLRNLGIYRDKARQGIENFRFPLVQQDVDGRDVLKSSQYFDGKLVDHIPSHNENPESAGIAIYDSKANSWEFFYRDRATDDQRALLDKRINQDGFKIIQVANPAAKPLMNVSKLEDTINFLVVKNYTNKPLDYQQIPYRGGGHKIYDQQWFVKQPIIRRKADADGINRHYYEGDNAMAVFYTEQEAKKYAAAIEKGRQLLDRPKELAAHLKKTLPYSVDQFMDFFKEGGKFHPQDPFTYTRSGLGTNDVFRNTGQDLGRKYENFEDLVDSSYNLFKDVNKKLAGQKDEDLPTIVENTTPNNPLALGPPTLLDPFAASANSLGEVARSRFLEDYKHQIQNQWLEEFKDVLKTPIQEIRNNPTYHFLNPEYNELAIDTEKVMAAKISHMHARDFTKLESPVAMAVNRIESKLMDSIYNKMGQKTSNIAANWLSPTTTDPFLFARQIVTNLKLGVFSLPQLFVQSAALVSMNAITGNPLRAAKAQAGAFLMRHAIRQGHQAIQGGLGTVASKLGWTTDEFMDSLSHLTATGYQHVGGDIAFLADYGVPKFFKSSKLGKANTWFWDKGMMFFKMAEGNNRLAAWNIAYLEFKKANPTKSIGSRERNQILQRAKNLNFNMTRESNSRIQQGVFSVTSQFTAYNMRLSEALLSFGKADRLTLAEKARLLTVNSLMYGVPVGGASSVLPVWPWYDDIKEYMFSQGIDPNSGWLEAVMEGLPNLMLEQLTGNEYDFGTRFGPNSLDMFHNIIHGDETISNILFGPSADVLPQLGNSAWTIGADILNVFSNGPEPIKLYISDMKDALSTISSVNSALKIATALNLGRYVTKNQMNLSEVDEWDSVLFSIGLSPREVQDAFIKSDGLKAHEAAQQLMKTQAIKWIRKAITETDDDNARDAYLKRARTFIVAGGFLPNEEPRILEEAFKGQESFVNTIRRRYAEQRPSPEDATAVRDAAMNEIERYKK